MPQSAKLTVQLDVAQAGNAVFGNVPQWAASIPIIQSLGDGVVAGAADIAYVAERTVLTGANDDIDLNGVLTQALGATFSAVKMVTLLIINQQRDGTANTTTLTVGGGTNPVVGMLGGTTPTVGPIRPGGVFLRSETDLAGICTITAGTGDILRVVNSSGATNKYMIAVIGRSA